MTYYNYLENIIFYSCLLKQYVAIKNRIYKKIDYYNFIIFVWISYVEKLDFDQLRRYIDNDYLLKINLK